MKIRFCEHDGITGSISMQPTPAAANWLLIHGLRWGVGASGLMLVMGDGGKEPNNRAPAPKNIDSYVIVISTDTIQSVASECRTKGLI